VVTTILARRSQFHQGRLAEQATPLNPNFQAMLSALAHQLARAGLSLSDAQRQALARFYASVRAQASALAYIDTYWVLACGRRRPRWRTLTLTGCLPFPPD